MIPLIGVYLGKKRNSPAGAATVPRLGRIQVDLSPGADREHDVCCAVGSESEAADDAAAAT
jgi:hypothetical protein